MPVKNMIKMLLSRFYLVSLMIFSVVVSADSGSVAIRGLVVDGKEYVAGQQITFDVKQTEKDFLVDDLPSLKLSILRHRRVRSDPKYSIESVYYTDANKEGWRGVNVTLPSMLDTGYYYLQWETKILHRDAGFSDQFKVISASEANAAKANPTEATVRKNSDGSPVTNSNVFVNDDGNDEKSENDLYDKEIGEDSDKKDD